MPQSNILLLGAVIGAMTGSGLGPAVGVMFVEPLTAVVLATLAGAVLGAGFAAAVGGQDETWPTTR